MSCDFDEKLLHLYLDGELSLGQRLRVERHLAACDDCRSAYKYLQGLSIDLRTASKQVRAPERLRLGVLNILNSEASRKPSRITAFHWLIPFTGRPVSSRLSTSLLMAAATLILFFVMVDFGDDDPIAAVLVEEHALDFEKSMAAPNSTDLKRIKLLLATTFPTGINIPECLSRSAKIIGGHMSRVADRDIVHIMYQDEMNRCSLYILSADSLSFNRKLTLVNGERSVQCGRHKGANYIILKKAEAAYMIISCCPHEKLLQMARTASLL